MRSLNVPNALSLSRIFFAPLVMLLLTNKIEAPLLSLSEWGVLITWGDFLAGFVFILASLTDAVDGYIARSKGLITNLGKFIDPLSDKVLVVAALLALVELRRVPSWMVMVIVARDFMVSGVRMAAATKGTVIAASRLGKLKTVVQIIAIVMLIFQIPFGLWVMGVAVILTIWSGVVYLINGWDLISDE